MWMGEKNTSRLLIFNSFLCSGRMAQWYEASIFALDEVWGAGSNPGGANTRFLIFVFFFFKSYFYPSVCFSLVTLFSFARFLRISSLREHGGGFSFSGDPEISVFSTKYHRPLYTKSFHSLYLFPTVLDPWSSLLF